MRRPFVVLWLATLLFYLGFQLLLPVIPLYAAQLGAGEAHVGFIIGVFALAVLLGPKPEWHYAVHGGFLAGAGIAATSFGINYAFAGRPFKLWAIDAGYHVIQYTIYGVLLGVWH